VWGMTTPCLSEAVLPLGRSPPAIPPGWQSDPTPICHYSESTTRPPFCEVAVAMARLVLNRGGVDLVTYKLGNVTTIGRAPLNQIVIDDPAVSAQHAIIARSDECYRLKDLHSTNGTLVNDVSITDVALQDGDKIQFGPIVAVFAGCHGEC
jgi:hypothetical protein